MPEGRSGWRAPVNVLVWQDTKSPHVGGQLTEHHSTNLANSSTYTPVSEHGVDTEGDRRLAVARYVDTSRGRVTTTVRRSLANASTHRWTDGETMDELDATWTDGESVTVGGRGPARTARAQRTYTMDGTTTLGAADRLRTVLTLGDRASVTESRGGRRTAWSRLADTHAGDATYKVPRDQRHAVGTTSERYRIHGAYGCYGRFLVAVQGVLTGDRGGC